MIILDYAEAHKCMDRYTQTNLSFIFFHRVVVYSFLASFSFLISEIPNLKFILFVIPKAIELNKIVIKSNKYNLDS